MELRRAGSVGGSGQTVRLAYCLNLHPGETPAEIIAGQRAVTLPLRERLAPGRVFGVGMYAPAAAAAELAHDAVARGELAAFLSDHGLDPFTWNAFPYGRFHEPGLKARVFEPTWADPERLEYTTHVARLAADLASACSEDAGGARHLSISTHTGMHSSHPSLGDGDLAGQAQVTLAAGLAGLEEETGWRAVLALEPEPRANCNDTADLARWRGALAERNGGLEAVLQRHLGTCLDACHAAVEFEDGERAIERATDHRAPLGKLQFTSALALRDPSAHPAARERLLSLAEPVFLHQVSGRPSTPGSELLRVGDLPELEAAFDAEPAPWLDCDEWRCHFHVPVDLREVEGGLGTTRDFADRLLDSLLARPERGGTDELHLEIETYTWSVLSRARVSQAELVDGLEAEYRHVLARLAAAGWHPA